ncbi:BspA family leucine-rich repeat surface protein [Tenacibaculum sp.]|uniref:BspA family leucine-rich repeat surface protein n=1 Tax=Tenacibaculum sp. TaxID=1906242 RepID=UPI003D1279E2
MKKLFYILLFVTSFCQGQMIIDAYKYQTVDTHSFISEWHTTTASELVTIRLSTSYTYDITVDWGDESGTTNFNATGDATSLNHTYATAGTYIITITPNSTNGWKGIAFSNTGDRLKIYDILQWGDSAIQVLNFYGCNNLTGGTATDVPNLTALTSMANSFRNCYVLNITNFGSWEPYNVSSFSQCFRDIPVDSNPDIRNWVTSNSTAVDIMLIYLTGWSRDLSNWDISNITTMNLFSIANGWTTADYSATLVGWAAQAPSIQTGVPLGATLTEFSEGLVDSGTTDGTTANKLVDSSQNFTTTVTVGDIVYNSTDDTYAEVTAIDSDTQLTIENDIMVSGDNYRVQGSDAAKARYVLSNDYSWSIDDNGGI